MDKPFSLRPTARHCGRQSRKAMTSALETTPTVPRVTAHQRATNVLPDPLFLLSPPRCFTSVVCAMLGQHEALYGLLETGLFNAPTMDLWWKRSRPAGLLRCVAQLFFDEQTEESIMKAEAWLRRRASLSTGYVFEQILERLS